MKTSTSPFIYEGAVIFMPEKTGKLQSQLQLTTQSIVRHLAIVRVREFQSVFFHSVSSAELCLAYHLYFSIFMFSIFRNIWG